MALQTSGQISLNDIHVEAGGTSQTMCSMNDTDIRGLTAAVGKTINSTLGTESDFADYYGASSITYMEIIPANGTYATYDSGDYRYYTFGAGQNTAPLLNSIGNADSGRIYWKMWGAGGGGGGGGTYAGADGGAGSYTAGYYVPTATGYLRIQVGTGGIGGENMNSNGLPTVDGGVGGQPNNITTTNLLGGDGGDGYGNAVSGRVGGGGGGGGATRLRTNWSNGSPASPTFEVWAGAGGGGGGSDQNASGSATPGGSGGSGLSNAGMGSTASGLTASSTNNSGGGGGAIAGTSGGAGGTLPANTNGSAGQAGVIYHGGDGGNGPSSYFAGGGGGGSGQYGGGGGATGSASQGAGGGGGSGYVSGSVTIQSGVRQSLGNRNSPVTYTSGWSVTDAQGGLKGPIISNVTSTITRAGDGGPGKVVLYHKFQN